MDVKFSSFWVNGWEFTKSLVSYLKPPVSFPLEFALLFSVMRDTFSVLFQLKLYMVLTKGDHQYTQFQIFDCSREMSPNLYSDKFLLLKRYRMPAKKVQRSYSEGAAEFEVKPSCCFKNEKHLVDLIQAHKDLKNLYFDWSFDLYLVLFKVYNVWPKKAQRCYLWKIQKMDSRFGKWHEKYGKFSPEHFKSVETRTLKGSFCPEWKMYGLKITEESRVMALKNDERFERELTGEVKSNMRSLTNFGHSTWKSQKFAL